VTIDGASGNVGIGTTAPNQLLTIEDTSSDPTLLIKAANDGNSRIQFGDQSSEAVGMIDYDHNLTGAMQFTSGGAVRVTFSQNGCVGIGTIGPGANLHVYRDDTGTGPLVYVQNDGTGDASIAFNLPTFASWVMGIDNSDGDKFKFANNTSDVGSSPIMTFDGSSGNVGIGTTSPAALLDIAETGGTGLLQLRFTNGGSPSNYFIIGRDNTVTGSLIFSSQANSNSLAITPAGNVGIGTASPGAMLTIAQGGGVLIGHDNPSNAGGVTPEFQILGTASADTQAMLGWYGPGASSAQITFLKSRNATIGAFTKVEDGDPVGSITWYADDGTNYNSAVASISVQIDGGTGTNDTPGRIIFSTTPDGTQAIVERMRIDNAGNVGIGTASPAHALDVVGTAGLSTGTAWTNTSDSRIKTNVQTITGALSKIKQLRSVSFQYTDEYLSVHDEIDGTKTYNSFVAEEYEDVFPDAVSIGGNLEIITDEETDEKEILIEDLKQFTPTDLPIYLVAAVQELSDKIDALSA
jgi:hypothetical protein